MIDWGLTTLSTQIGYYRASDKYVAVKKVKLIRKLIMLRVGNIYSKPLQSMTLQSGHNSQSLNYNDKNKEHCVNHIELNNHN